MPAATVDLTIEQGATWNQIIIWTDSTGAPVPLTGFIGRMQARTTIPGSSTLIDLTTANGGVLIDAPNGTITLVMTAAQTAALNWPAGSWVQDVGFYQLELESPTGFVTRLLKGKITLDPEVTRAAGPLGSGAAPSSLVHIGE